MVAVHRGYSRRGVVTRADQYRACAAEGLTQAETARRLGVSTPAVRQYAKRHGLTFTDGRRTLAHAKRAAENLRAAQQCPEFRAKVSAGLRRYHKRRRDEFRAELGPVNYEHFRFLRWRKKFRRAEALRTIGRADLIEGAEA